MRTAVMGVALAAGLAVACGGGTDTEEGVRKALDGANMQQVVVAVDDQAQIVHLKGSVDSLDERSQAEEVATAVVGTTGRVLNELTVVGLNGDTADDFDDEIIDTLDDTIDQDPVLKQRDINFEAANGMVTVTGEVRSAAEKSRVTRIVRVAPGVKDVANGLKIEPLP